MNKNTIVVIVIVIVLIGGGTLLYNSFIMGTIPADEVDLPPSEFDLPEVMQPMPIVPEGGRMMEDGTMQDDSRTPVEEKIVVREITVTGKSFSFSPAVMTMKKGERVKITFKNSGGMHDLRIDEFNIATKRLDAGEEETIEFTADKAGTFEYYCSVGNHRAMGMKGTLVVQ